MKTSFGDFISLVLVNFGCEMFTSIVSPGWVLCDVLPIFVLDRKNMIEKVEFIMDWSFFIVKNKNEINLLKINYHFKKHLIKSYWK